MTQRTCTLGDCARPHYSKGMCKPCYRRDYYAKNRERENATNAKWRKNNYEYDRQRFAAYAELRWGPAREARKNELRLRLEANDKTCTRCGDTKAKDSFHRDPRRRDGLHSWCKACFHAHVASMRTQESEAARRARAYAIPETRARLLAKHRRWAKANPVKNRELARRYQARKRCATRGRVDYGRIIERDGMVCHLCALVIEHLDDLHFDHVIPLVRGGHHSMANVKPAHGACNLRKGSKLVSELDWAVRPAH